MTATSLDLAANLTGAGVTEGQEKTWFTVMRAALAEMGDPMGRPGAIQNLSLVFSVASNALTCNVKTRAGAAPSATDPAAVSLRNATLATGDFHVLDIIAALSFTISSGSTLGHTNAVAGDIFWYIIDNAGAAELAASTKYFGSQGIVSTTAEGGAGAADSATVMYSTTARSNVAFRCIGHTIDTQTTAGTWTAVPTTSEIAPFDLEAIAQTLTNKTINSAIGIGQTLVKRKTADESVTSSTTLQDDDHLTFAIAANEEWVVRITGFGGAVINSTGIKMSMSVPASAVLRQTLSLMSDTSVGQCISASSTGSALAFSAVLLPSFSDAMFVLDVWILNSTNAGNVTLQWAQVNSSGTPLTFSKGSFLTAHRVA